MKSNYSIQSSLVILVLTLFIACSEEEVHDAVILEPDTLTAEGYIAGNDRCLVSIPYKKGDGLIIVTEQDTFMTYNFPEDIFNFPEEILLNGYFFPPDYSDQYKVGFTYLKVPEDERKIVFCSGNIEFFFGFISREIRKNEIKITEVKKIIEVQGT